jgi:hypothetical protein
MLPTLDKHNNLPPQQNLSWEQRLLKNAGRPRGTLKPEYQELKFTLHRKLLDRRWPRSTTSACAAKCARR